MNISQTLTKPAYDLSEIPRIVPVGRTTLYSEIRAGRLKVQKIGRRTVCLASSLAEWLESLPDAPSGDQKAA